MFYFYSEPFMLAANKSDMLTPVLVEATNGATGNNLQNNLSVGFRKAETATGTNVTRKVKEEIS